MSSDIRIIDLCAGIGGFSLGFERTNRAFRTVAFCEQNQFCQQILKKHWPKVPIFDDIKTFGYEGEAEIITAGLPCQPFSVAGRQKGTTDDRHLWPFMREIIEQKRPQFIVIENVPNIINLGYDEICVGLEAENYAASTLLFPACAVGAPHLRNRLFIIGVNVADSPIKRVEGSRPAWKQEPQQPFEKKISRRNGTGSRTKNRRSRPTICGIPDGFSYWLDTVEPPRITTEKTDRKKRLEALGNAVLPQAVSFIAHGILKEIRNGKE